MSEEKKEETKLSTAEQHEATVRKWAAYIHRLQIDPRRKKEGRERE